MIRGGFWGGAWGLSWGGAWGEAWQLLNQPYQELSLKGQVFVRSYLTSIHSVEVAEQIVSVAALNNISVIDAEVVVTAKHYAASVESVRLSRKSKITPETTSTPSRQPSNSIAVKSAVPGVISVIREAFVMTATEQRSMDAIHNEQRAYLVKHSN